MHCTGTSGFQYSGVSSGPHIVTVRANNSVEVLLLSCRVEVEVLAVDILGITGKQKVVSFCVAQIMTSIQEHKILVHKLLLIILRQVNLFQFSVALMEEN